MGRRAEESWYDSLQEQTIFLFSKASVWGMRPTQPPNHWVPSWGDRGVKLFTDLHPLLRLRLHKAVPPLPHLPSWRARGARYLYLYHEDRRSGNVGPCIFVIKQYACFYEMATCFDSSSVIIKPTKTRTWWFVVQPYIYDCTACP
jgi:hypothetical protein